MKLLQIQYVVEVYRQGNHISAAAQALNTSQPGVSKQIKLLEYELGFEIFQRKRNRIVGLTEPGRAVIEIAQRVLNDIGDLSRIREDFVTIQQGTLMIATTHTHARYVLPKVIREFVKRYPNVRLGLVQGNPTEICEAVESGHADLAVGTETMRPFPDLLVLPCFPIHRSLIAKRGHPLLEVEPLTLEEIAMYPMISHDPFRSGRWKVIEAFEKAGIKPNVLFEAVDADVSKTYVELGLGISVLASLAVDPERDQLLGARDVRHLFESSTTHVTLRANTYVRRFVFDFIELLAPQLTRKAVQLALKKRTTV